MAAKKTIAQLEKELAQVKEELKATKVAAGEDVPEIITVEDHEKQMKELEEKFEAAREKIEEEKEIQHEISQKTAEELKNAIDNLKNGKVLLFKKMSLALKEVQRIPKTGWNDFHKYKYAQEGDILDGIRPILSDVGLAVFPNLVEEKKIITPFYKSGFEKGHKTITHVKMLFTIACTDSGETLEISFSGEGEDEGDKGLYKAYTGATKYFLTKTFLISSGDMLVDDKPSDPEADTHRDDFQDPKTTANQYKNKNKGQYTQNQNKPQDKPKDEPKQATKSELIGYWKLMGGTEDDFPEFYTKQMKKGLTHNDIATWLKMKVEERKANQNDQPQDKPQDQPEDKPQDQPQDNDAPPENEEQAPPKNPDDMTAEEYVAYVEESLPFPLTETERAAMIEKAKNGEIDRNKK
jgi:hypothetical protein